MRWPALLDKTPRQGRLAALALAAVALVLAASFTRPEVAAWLALALAVPALALAGVALAKAKMLEFCPEVLGGDVILPRAAITGERVKLLLPLQFNNAGHADGIVEWIAVRLTLDGRGDQALLLSPVAEVDMQRFIQAKRKLEQESIIEPFTSFALEGRRSAAKFVLFDHTERNRARPLELRPGRYSFEVFVKSTRSRQPQLARSFEHVLEPQQLEDFRNGATVYLINYDITLPGVRRAVAGAEWLPRASAV
ncbi:MAG TPA: hypothetical protein VNP36_18535 [Burkholderiales bacterium]|nr:hypothetical protein [Burkholderiales bacterium]